AERGDLLTHDRDQNVLTLMKLEDVIETDFIPVHPDMGLGRMLHECVSWSTRNIFPVTDENQALVGIVLLDNIRKVMFDTALYDTTIVENYMHTPPELIFFKTDNMKTVMQKFQDTGAWNLPVVKDGKY